MNTSSNNNNNNNNRRIRTNGGILKFIIVAVIFVIMLVVTGNYKSFLPFIDWEGEDNSSYSQEIDYDSDTDSDVADDSSVPEEDPVSEQTSSATTAAPEITTTAADTEPADEPVEITYNFRNRSTYDSHYEKHGAEFGDITQEEYLQMANELIASDADTVLTKYADDGDFMYFDTATGYFLVLSPDNYIRTFFVPDDGIEYWDRQ